MAKVNPIPDGYTRVTPYLAVDGASDAIDFYVKVLGAKERMRMPGPDGKLGHAEIEIGDSVIMLSDEYPGMATGPKSLGGTPVSILVYVEDVDATHKKALDAGATEIQAARGQVLRRPLGDVRGPVGPQVERRVAHRGRAARRDGEARREGHAGDGLAQAPRRAPRGTRGSSRRSRRARTRS